MTLGGVLEWILGNTFAFVVFCSYGKSIQLLLSEETNGERDLTSL